MAFFFFGVGQRRMRAIVYETGLIFPQHIVLLYLIGGHRGRGGKEVPRITWRLLPRRLE